MKKLLAALLALLPAVACAQSPSYPSPTFGHVTLNGPGSTGDVSGMSATATGGSAATTLADWEAQAINVVSFGAKQDTKTFTDGAITTGTTAFCSASTTFSSADVGKVIQVDGAAGVGSPPLVTTIAGYTSTHCVSLTATATATAPRSYMASATVTISGASGSYIPGETVTVSGGTSTTGAVARIQSTTARTASVNNAGTGGASGACVLTGTTGTAAPGTGTFFQVNATISGGSIASLGGFVDSGHYSANPSSLAAEPVTSNCGLTGATLALTMGADTVSVQTAGNYSVTPANNAATGAGSSSGATGATLTVTWKATGTGYYGTDDAAAINAAITAAAATGRAVTIYNTGSNIMVGSPIVPVSNTTILCVGYPTLFLKGGANSPVVESANFESLIGAAAPGNPGGTSNVQINGCIIDGNKASQSAAVNQDFQTGISIYGTGYVIRNTTVNNVFGNGIYVGAYYWATLPARNADTIIENVQVTHSGRRGIWLWSPSDGYMSDVYVIDASESADAGYCGLDMQAGAIVHHFHAWHQAAALNRVSYQACVGYGSKVDQSDFEGGRQQLLLRGGRNQVTNSVSYAPFGPAGVAMVDVTGNNNILMGTTFVGYDWTNYYALSIGTGGTASGGNTIKDNQYFKFTANTPYNFRNNSGGNLISGYGYMTPGGGTSFGGTVSADDTIDYDQGGTVIHFHQHPFGSALGILTPALSGNNGATPQYVLLGTWTATAQSQTLNLQIQGVNGFNAGTQDTGTTYANFRVLNDNTLAGNYFTFLGAAGSGPFDLAWKNTSGTTYQIWMRTAGAYHQYDTIPSGDGTFLPSGVGTGSTTLPAGATSLTPQFTVNLGTGSGSVFPLTATATAIMAGVPITTASGDLTISPAQNALIRPVGDFALDVIDVPGATHGVKAYGTIGNGGVLDTSAGQLDLKSAGTSIATLTGGKATVKAHLEYNSATPTVVAGTNAGIAGNDEIGRVTVGTGPGTTVALTFASNTWTHPPICFAQNETSAVWMRASTVSTSGVTFTASGALTAADAVSYHCGSYN